MARRTSPDGPTDSRDSRADSRADSPADGPDGRADSPADGPDGRADSPDSRADGRADSRDGLADVIPITPHGVRVHTYAGDCWARMGTPAGPGALTRQVGDKYRHLCPLPELIHRVVYRDSTGTIVRRAIAMRWHDGPTQYVDYATMARDDSWIAGPIAPTEPKVIQAMAQAIRDASLSVPEIEGAPHFADGQPILPPAGYGPAGYAPLTDDDYGARRAWRAVADLARDNPKLALVAGAAFAGIYVTPLDRDPFILHLVGDSSEGKTTALRLAAAVLGDPRHVLRPWNVTPVALGRRLGALRILPAVVDELGASAMTASALEALLYRVTEGVDREAGTRTGGGTVTGAVWRSVLITSGNRGLSNVTDNPGLPARVIDLPSPITRTAAAAHAIDQLLPAAAGWPLRWLLEEPDLDAMRQFLAEGEEQLDAGRGGVAGRVARHLALCVAGARQLGRLITIGARHLGTAALEAAGEHLADLDAQLGERGRMADRLYDAVLEAANVRPFAWPERDDYEHRPRDIQKEVEGLHDGDRLLVFTGQLDRIAAAAGIADPLPWLRELRRRGVLRSDHGKLSSRIRTPDRILRVYTFSAKDPDMAEGPRALEELRVYTFSAKDPDMAEGPRALEELPRAPAPEKRGCPDLPKGGVARPARPARPCFEEGRMCAREEALGQRLVALDPTTAERITELDDLDAMEAALDALDALPPPPPLPAPQRAPQGGLRALREPLDLDTRRAMFARALAGLDIAAGPDQIAAGLAALEAAAGLTYEGPTPGRAGLQWIRALPGPRPEPRTVQLPATNPPGPGRVRSAFSLTDPAQADHPGQLVQLDINAAFANAAQSLELGTGDPVEVPAPTRADLKHPGWITVANPSPAWPAPFARLEPGELLWTPLAALLAERVPAAELVDAVIWPEHRRWLRAFARRCLDARAALAAAGDPAARLALVVLKATYSKTLGGMLNAPAHNRTPYLRPDWAWLIKAAAAAAMWRHLGRLEGGPAAVYAPDAALFIVTPGELPALEISAQPGKWKLERRTEITPAMRTALRAGQPLKVIQLAKREPTL